MTNSPKRILAIIAVVLSALIAGAQTVPPHVTLSATIKDPNGHPLSKAVYAIQLVDSVGRAIPGTTAATYQGQPVSPTRYTGSLDTAGTFTASVVPNNATGLLPQTTRWQINISAPTAMYLYNNAQAWSIQYITAVTADVDLSSQISALAQPISYIDVNGPSAFLQPVYGITPTDPRQLATKAYVDATVGTGGAVQSGLQFQLPAYTASLFPQIGPSNVTIDATGNNLTVPGSVTIPGCSGKVVAADGTGCVLSGASAVSGQTNGKIPLATGSNVIGAPSHLDDGVTTPSTITSTEAIVAPSVTVPGAVAASTVVVGGPPTIDITNPLYGGVCDGTTDIGPAVQAAVNAAPSAGAIIYFPGAVSACYWANPTTLVWPNKTLTLQIAGALKVGTTLHTPFGSRVNMEGKTGIAPAQFQMAGTTAIIIQRNAANLPITGTIGTATTATYSGVGTPTGSTPAACTPSSGLAGSTYNDTSGALAYLWTCAATQGSITNGTNTLTVTTAGGLQPADAISIAGAGASGGTLVASITAISGTTYTLSLNASTTVTNANVTLLGGANLGVNWPPVSNWRQGGLFTFTPSSMQGIYPGTSLGIAEKTTCSFSTISRTSLLVTATFASACHIPISVPVTVAGVTASTFNGTHTNGVTSGPWQIVDADYVNNTLKWRQSSGVDATSSGGTITGFFEDNPEVITVTSTTSTTATAFFFRTHISTAQFGAVGVHIGTAGQAAQLKDLFISADGPDLAFDAYRAKITNVGTANTGACSGNLTAWAVEMGETNFNVVDGVSFGSFCTPWTVHFTKRWANVAGFTGNTTFHNSVFNGAGIKLDHGAETVTVDGNSFCEVCGRGFVTMDGNDFAAGTGVPNTITISDAIMQDNGPGYLGSMFFQTQPINNILLPNVRLHNVFGYSQNLVNDAFNGNLISDTVGNYSVNNTTQRGLIGTFDNGNVRDGENRASGANFSPSLIPHSTENIQTNPASWSGGGCTITTGVTGPDGTPTAGSTSGASGNFSIGNKTITPAVGDMVLFGVDVYTPTAGGRTVVDSAGWPLWVDNNSSANYTLQAAYTSGTLYRAPVNDPLFPNDWWHRVVGFTYVTSSNGTAGQLVRLLIGCNSNKTLTYANPFMVYISASEGFSMAEVLRWRAQNFHGPVPASMPAGGGILAMNTNHKLYWGNDTNLYRKSAGVLGADDDFDIASGKNYKINGTQIKLTNLGDVTNSGAVTNYVMTCTTVVAGICTNATWTTGSAGGTVAGPGSTVVNDSACWNNTSGTLLLDSPSGCFGAPLNGLVEDVTIVSTSVSFGWWGPCASQTATLQGASANAPATVQGNSSTTSGTCSGWVAPANEYYSGRQPQMTGTISFNASTDYSATSRIWFGMVASGTGCAQANVIASDAPTCTYAMIRWSTSASDATWQCVSDNGSGTPQITAIGATTPTVNNQTLSVSINGSGATCTVGATSVTNATKFPGATSSMYGIANNTTLAAATNHIRLGRVVGVSHSGSW